MEKFVKIASVSEIPSGSAKQIEIEGKEIAVFNLQGQYFAIDNACTHVGGSLAEGTIVEDRVVCPWHGATFSIKTGEVLTPPAGEAVATYKVRVQGSDLEVEV